MLESLQSLIAPAVMQRLTLLLNHVLASESVATQRLKPHAGRRVQLNAVGWPQVLPALPRIEFAVTPAGLLEWLGDDSFAQAGGPVDLTLTLDASNPARVLWDAVSGQRPRIEVTGDSALAADISWLMDNLRWDVQDDLARLVGQMPAHELGRVAQGVATALRETAGRVAGLAQKARAGQGPGSA